MSYTKYTTQGIIVGGSNIGEASRSLSIFTREFGLIRANVQGIRKLDSKLKYHLQNLSLVDLVIIKGKNGWKVTEAYKMKSFPAIFGSDKNKLQTSTRILLFLKKMLPEEDSNRELFDIISKGFDFMEPDIFSADDVSDLENLMILRALRNLGYVKGNQELKGLLSGNVYDKDVLMRTKRVKSSVIAEINQSIKASEL